METDVRLGQNVKCSAGWKRINLEAEEENVLLKLLGKHNKAVMYDCFLEAEEFVDELYGKSIISKETSIYTDILIKIALSLFDKKATQMYTVKQAALENKIAKLREGMW